MPVEDRVYPDVGDPGVDALHYELTLTWDPDAQHAGPPAALLGRAIENCGDGEGKHVGRVTFEVLRPVPISTLTVSAEVVRPGRSVELIEGSLADGDGEVFASVFREDVDFVTVRGEELYGRRAVAAGHARLFAGPYRNSKLTAVPSRSHACRKESCRGKRGNQTSFKLMPGAPTSTTLPSRSTDVGVP